MKFYSYDPITGECLSGGDADPDPQTEGSFLFPAFSTTVEPPAPVYGHKAVWQAGVWTELPIEFIAPAAEPITLDQAKAQKLALVRQDLENELNSGFSVGTKQFAADPQSQINMLLAALIASQPGAPASVMWKLQDNSTVSLTAEDVAQMVAALGSFRQDVYARHWQREAAVQAATTVEELASL